MVMARTAAVVLTLAAILILAGCGADPAFTSGKVYLQQENLDRAIEQFQIAIRNDAQAWEPRMWLGRAYAEIEELQMAHDEFFASLDLAVEPSAKDEIENTITYYWQIYQNEGNLQNSQSNYAGAVAEFEKALVIDSRKADSYANLGYSYHMNMDFDSAVDAFEMALERAPDNQDLKDNLVSVYESKAGSLAGLGDTELALRYFEKIEMIAPETQDIYYNIGLMHYQLKDYRAAIRSFNQHLDRSEGDEEVLYRVFLAYWGIAKGLEDDGQTELAVPEFETAIPILEELIELNFEELTYHRALARVYNKLGMTEEALLELGIVDQLVRGVDTTTE
ncbi:tetratricopeptide repeat protein [bacterium]|nr:tetratricopeptide repeat protein [bacterium]